MSILNALCERFVQLLTTIWGWKTFNLVMRSAKNFSPLATYPTSSPKRVVKSQTFLGFEIDNPGFTLWICIFTLWKWTYLFEIDNPGFIVWICIFTLWIRGYLFQIREKFGTSRHVSELMWGRYPVGQIFFRPHMTHLSYFHTHIIPESWIRFWKLYTAISW